MLDTLCQTRRTAEKQNDIGGHVQQHLVGAGILYSGKQEHTEHQLTQRQHRQAGLFPLDAEPQTKQDQNKVQQTGAHGMIIELYCNAADIIVRIAVGVVKSQDLADHGPEQDHHCCHGADTKQDEVAYSAQGKVLLALFCELCTAYKEQKRIGKIIAHHKI